MREPGVFIVDDVAFVHAEHGHAIADEIERRNIRKQYYLETRCDVLLKNKEVFARWKKLGLSYMFLGVEAIDEEGLQLHRKRVSLGKNFEALEYARSLGIIVAVNIIADPSLGRGALRSGPRMGAVGARDRASHRQHALSRHRDLDHRRAQLRHPQLQALRRAARRAAHELPLENSTRSWSRPSRSSSRSTWAGGRSGAAPRSPPATSCAARPTS